MQGFYFNSWKGGDGPNADRLLTLLSEVDVAAADDPRLDRALDFVSPTEDRTLFRFEQRGAYDREILRSLYDELPRDVSGKASEHRADAHRRFIAMARRRAFFERRDAGWRSMLPYKTAYELLEVVRGDSGAEGSCSNRCSSPSTEARGSRGLSASAPTSRSRYAASRVAACAPTGSTRASASVALNAHASRSRFVEHMPTGLLLRYHDPAGLDVSCSSRSTSTRCSGA